MAILGDFDGFRSRIFGWLSAGGPCGYSLDGAAFNACLLYTSLHRCSRNPRYLEAAKEAQGFIENILRNHDTLYVSCLLYTSRCV